jgi:hypothetical protein
MEQWAKQTLYRYSSTIPNFIAGRMYPERCTVSTCMYDTPMKKEQGGDNEVTYYGEITCDRRLFPDEMYEYGLDYIPTGMHGLTEPFLP